MSTTRLMVLGLVRWLEPVHGYDVRRELLSWSVDDWANIQPGSIYHALRKLTEDGLLEEVSTEQVGARPARTTYRVTAAGAAEFEQLLRQSWWEYEQPLDPFLPAFSFLPALPRREAAAALRNRAALLHEHLERVRGMVAEIPAATDATDAKPPHVGWMLELQIDRCVAEIGWCRRIADRIDAGQGAHVGEYDVAKAGEQWREAIAREHDREPD